MKIEIHHYHHSSRRIMDNLELILHKLAKKAKEKVNIKPPKSLIELKERSEKLGYPIKEIR